MFGPSPPWRLPIGFRAAHLALVAVLGLLCCRNPPVPDERDLLGDPPTWPRRCRTSWARTSPGPTCAAALLPGRLPGMGAEIGKPPIFALDQVALVINLGDSVERAQCASCGRQGVASEWRHGLRCQAANEDRPQNVARCGIREGTGGYAAGLMFMDVEPMFAGICEVRDDQGA